MSSFRITFSVVWPDTKYSKEAVIKIFNLAPDTVNRLTKGEFTRVQLLAGYADNSGLIFSGEIRYTIDGRDNPTDTFVIIQALECDQAFCYATVNTTLAAGYSKADTFRALLKSVGEYGITTGVAPQFDDVKMPRGKPLYGMHRDEMENLASQSDATWQYVGDTIQIRPKNTYSHQAVVLNYQTGLVGLPQQTIGGGINVRCLINPSIQINGLIRLDNSTIYKTMLNPDDVRLPNSEQITPSEPDVNGVITYPGAKSPPAALSRDGDYKVVNLSYMGDTRGKPWYMDLVCIAKGSSDIMNVTTVAPSND